MDSEVKRFAELASSYCAWAEAPSSTQEEDVARACLLLPQLYAAAFALPPGQPADEPEGCSDAEWKTVYARFGRLPVGYYGDALDPLQVPPDEPAISDVGDDLADIYRDLM